MGELVEYLVITKCGRRFCWSATDLNSLFRDMHERNYTVSFVMEYHLFKQLESNPNKEIIMRAYERELKHTA